MKNKTIVVDENYVIKILTEVAGKDAPLVRMKIFSPIPDGQLSLGRACPYAAGLSVAYRLLENKKHSLKKENGGLREPIAIVPCEIAYEDDLPELIRSANNKTNQLYICLNQQISVDGTANYATPKGARTKSGLLPTTLWGGPYSELPICEILAIAGGDYVAQTSGFFESDLRKKVKKALDLKGFRFVNVLVPSLYWGYDSEDLEKIGQLANDTGHFPHFEYEQGKWKLERMTDILKPLSGYFSLQKRFRHLLEPGNRKLLSSLQERVNDRWEELIKRQK